jgi:hypothetical protein
MGRFTSRKPGDIARATGKLWRIAPDGTRTAIPLHRAS